MNPQCCSKGHIRQLRTTEIFQVKSISSLGPLNASSPQWVLMASSWNPQPHPEVRKWLSFLPYSCGMWRGWAHSTPGSKESLTSLTSLELSKTLQFQTFCICSECLSVIGELWRPSLCVVHGWSRTFLGNVRLIHDYKFISTAKTNQHY